MKSRMYTFNISLILILALTLLTGCGAPAAPAAPAATTAPAAPAAPAATTAPAAPAAPAATTAPAAPAAPAAPVAQTEEVVVLLAGEPATLDWQMHTDLNAHTVDRQIFDTLLRRDRNTLEVVPHLAESFTLVNDTTWEFKLRKGVKFHNGEDFNAAAAKFSIDRMLDPESKATGRANVKLIDHTDIIDDYTIQIVTSAPFPLLPKRLVSAETGTVPMIPPKYFEEKGADYFASHPVGTGPFKFVEWKKDEYVKLEANNDWFGGAPAIKTLFFKPVPEPATRVAALLSGQADIAAGIAPEDLDKINNSGVATVKTSPRANWVINIMVTNYVTPGPWTDVRVRQALNYAVDMDTIIATLLGGNAKRIGYSLEPDAFGFDPSIQWYGYDPEKAKQLLAEAGYADGFEMVLNAPNHRYINDVEIANAVANYWGKIGVKTEVKVWEQSVYVTKWRVKELQPAFITAWGGSGLLDGDLLTNAYHTESAISIFSNKELDGYLNEAAATMDEAKRKELYSKAQQLIFEEAPSVQSWQPSVFFGVSNNMDWDPWIGTTIFLAQPDYKAAKK